MDAQDRFARGGSSCSLDLEHQRAAPGTIPRTAWSRQNSLLGRPPTQSPLRGFILDLFKQEIQLARRRIAIDLVVPPLLLTCTEPFEQAPVLVRNQLRDGCFDFLNTVHTRRVSIAAVTTHITPAPQK